MAQNKVYAALKKRDPLFVAGLQSFADIFGARVITIDDFRTGERVVDRTGHALHVRAVQRIKDTKKPQ